MNFISRHLFICLVALTIGMHGKGYAQNEAPNLNAADQIETLFLQGMAAVVSGKPADAIPIFRSILARDPSLARVRLELALSYYLVEQWGRARSEFYTLLSANLPEPVRIKVMRFIQKIDGRRGFDWDMSIGLVSTGNQRFYETDEILLDFGSGELPFTLDRAPSGGIGLKLTGDAKLQKQLVSLSTTSTIATGALGVFADVTDASATLFDDTILGLSSELRFSGRTLTYSIASEVSTRFLANKHYENIYGLDAAFEGRSESGLSYFGSGSFKIVDNQLSDVLDGKKHSISLGLRQSFAGRGFAGFAFFSELNDVGLTLENHQIHGMRLFASLDAKYGLTLKPSITFSRKTFPVANPLFTESPDEKSVKAAVRVEKNDIFVGDGFSPFIDIGITSTNSDISAFSYKEKYIYLGLQRNY